MYANALVRVDNPEESIANLVILARKAEEDNDFTKLRIVFDGLFQGKYHFLKLLGIGSTSIVCKINIGG